MIQTKVIKNVFTPSQIDYIYQLIEQNKINPNRNVNKELLDEARAKRGRDDLDLTPGGAQTLNPEFRDVILKHFEPGNYITNISLGDYNNRITNPNLPNHMDAIHTDKGWTFDYVLDYNLDWPICVEGDCYDLKKNDAIIFNPCGQWHNRPELQFKDTDYYRVLFIQVKQR